MLSSQIAFKLREIAYEYEKGLIQDHHALLWRIISLVGINGQTWGEQPKPKIRAVNDILKIAGEYETGQITDPADLIAKIFHAVVEGE